MKQEKINWSAFVAVPLWLIFWMFVPSLAIVTKITRTFVYCCTPIHTLLHSASLFCGRFCDWSERTLTDIDAWSER